jgi:hypothetical protein
MHSIKGIPLALSAAHIAISAALALLVALALVFAAAVGQPHPTMQPHADLLAGVHLSDALAPAAAVPAPAADAGASLTPTPTLSAPEAPPGDAESLEAPVGEVAAEPVPEPGPEPVAVVYPEGEDAYRERVAAYESGGDPWAENGRYKGAWQLDESYYPGLIGLTWAEVAGDVAAQRAAADAYVAGRYGSWAGAWAHIEMMGWY